jgi:hypothetical protein
MVMSVIPIETAEFSVYLLVFVLSWILYIMLEGRGFWKTRSDGNWSVGV